MALTPDELRRLNKLLDDIEDGHLGIVGERQLRGLLARLDGKALTMDLAALYNFGTLAAGLLRLLGTPEAQAALVDVEPTPVA